MQRQSFWPHNSFLATAKKGNNYQHQREEQESEVSTELSISSKIPSPIKKLKTSKTSSSTSALLKEESPVDIIVASTKINVSKTAEFFTNNNFSKEEISTELTLFDNSWITKNGRSTEVSDHIEEPVSNDKLNQYLVACKIYSMKFYTPREEEQERLMGVSTKLTLFDDPWKIKKKLTGSDLGNMTRLMVKTRMVKDYVLPLLSNNLVNEIKSKKGARVMVWDQDTKSLHQLIFKRWRASKSYVFIGWWSQDFVRRRNLKEGDEIGLYWDPYDSRFNFRVLERAQSDQPSV